MKSGDLVRLTNLIEKVDVQLTWCGVLLYEDPGEGSVWAVSFENGIWFLDKSEFEVINE
tara:strand:- start:497 stop:673 length:177 start_codon:yes stop_codon:yes gene_type:complete